MRVKTALAAAMLFGSLAAGLLAGSRPGSESLAFAPDTLEVAMAECAGGYHADARGNCQPDNGIVDNRCQAGFEAAPFPNGNNYRCVAIPRGY